MHQRARSVFNRFLRYGPRAPSQFSRGAKQSVWGDVLMSGQGRTGVSREDRGSRAPHVPLRPLRSSVSRPNPTSLRSILDLLFPPSDPGAEPAPSRKADHPTVIRRRLIDESRRLQRVVVPLATHRQLGDVVQLGIERSAHFRTRHRQSANVQQRQPTTSTNSIRKKSRKDCTLDSLLSPKGVEVQATLACSATSCPLKRRAY